MRLIESSFENFVLFRGRHVLPIADQGLVLVEGINRDHPAFDSNGTSKSMLFEPMTWCFFDKMIRHGNDRVSRDDVCIDAAATASNIFETSAGVFRCTRSIEKPRFKIETRDGDSWVPLRGQSRDVNRDDDDISALIGFDYVTYRSALVMQKQSLGVSTFAVEMKILESILRFDDFTRASKLANEHVKSLELSTRSELDAMAQVSHRIETLQATVKSLEDLNEDAREQELEKEIFELERTLMDDGGGSRIDRQRRRVERFSDNLSFAQSVLTGCNVQFKNALSRVEKFRLLVKSESPEVNIQCPTCEQDVSRYQMLSMVEDAERERDLAASLREHAEENFDRSSAQDRGERDQLRALEDAGRVLHQARRERADIQQRKSLRLTTIQRHKGDLDVAERELADLTARVTDVRRERSIAGHGKESLDGMKPETLAAASPVLNDAAERYSAILTDGAIQVRFNPLRESRNEDLIRVESPTAHTYEQCSSGEQRRADLIIALARRRLARWRLGTPINFSVWDEVFDPLDATGLQRAMEILQQDIDEMESVFIITHREDLKAMFPGARTLLVEREHNASTFSVSG